MSVTSEEVIVPAGYIGGGGTTPPPTTAFSASSISIATTAAVAVTSSLPNSASTPITTTTTSATATSTSSSLSPTVGMEDVVRSGYLRKLKGRKKFFVLRKETRIDRPARLEYYDKEKKFRTGQPPKKTMQNYSKEDLIPGSRDPRRRTYTWNNDQTLGSRTSSIHSSAPSGMTRIPSSDGSVAGNRGRTDSMSSTLSNKGFGMSPPVPIMSQPPSFAFNSPMCSTGTDSASSSYSVDYDNNNHHPAHQRSNPYGSTDAGYSKSHEEDVSYVPWNPSDEQQASLNSLSSLNLPLNPDNNDYVETSLASKDSSSTAQTPSSYMEMQSPVSPFDNYMPMSPGCSSNSNSKNSGTGKVSVSHSRNSSLVEENEGYVPMNPYHMSPASSESIQSGTPSSDFPLEKVSSYLTDDFDDTVSMRHIRAYSVGPRSDTSSVGKNRCGKNRLEAVQETFRIRAMSVGTKVKKPFVHPNSALYASPSAMLSSGKSPAPPLSSSWSCSTARWPPSKPNHSQIPTLPNHTQPVYNYTGSESNDSDLMELDFSHNKTKSRKRSLPGPNGNHNNTPSSTGSAASSITKISPAPKGLLCGNGRDTPPKSEGNDGSKSGSAIITTTNCINGVPPVPKYLSSALISIQKQKVPEVSYHDSPTGSSILTKMTGMNITKLKELDDEGAYLDMDFSNKPSEKSHNKVSVTSNHHEVMSNLKNNFFNKPQPVIIKANESPTACKVSKFSLNSTQPTTNTFSDSHQSSTNKTDTTASLVRSLSNSSSLSSVSTQSNSSSNSTLSIKTQQEVDAIRGDVVSPKTSSNSVSHSSNSEHVTSTSNGPIMCGLSRIEEFPEKQESKSHNLTPLHSPPTTPIHAATPDDEKKVTYAAIEHLPPKLWRSYSSTSSSGASSGPSCGSSAVSSKAGSVTYAQIDFVKNAAETITPN